MPTNLHRVRDRIRAFENSTESQDFKSIAELLENLLFDDYSYGSKESTIELIIAYLERNDY